MAAKQSEKMLWGCTNGFQLDQAQVPVAISISTMVGG